MKVQLLYFAGCPAIADARQALLHALAAVAPGAHIEEIELARTETRWPSPTVLIDDAEWTGAQAGDGTACRLYASEGGLTPIPPEAALRRALRRAAHEQET